MPKHPKDRLDLTAVGERLEDLRRRVGNPSHHQIALAIGAARRSYQYWEYGEKETCLQNYEALARYFSERLVVPVPVEYITHGYHEPEWPPPEAAPAEPSPEAAPVGSRDLDRLARSVTAAVDYRLGEVVERVDQTIEDVRDRLKAELAEELREIVAAELSSLFNSEALIGAP
jgi:hypothetical protein